MGWGSGALDCAHLTLELERALDVTQYDGAGTGARDLDGAIIEHAPPETLFHQYALDLADDDLVGMAMDPAIAVEEPLVAYKDGGRQVVDEGAQMQISPAGEPRLVDNGLAGRDNLANFHN